MYSESDLQTAVDARVLTPEAAAAFRSHIASVRAAPGADEEHFRLITGFNDIFVSIAAVILLVAVAWIGESIYKALAGAFVAASARSEEHTSELQSLMRTSYAVFCLTKQNKKHTQPTRQPAS